METNWDVEFRIPVRKAQTQQSTSKTVPKKRLIPRSITRKILAVRDEAYEMRREKEKAEEAQRELTKAQRWEEWKMQHEADLATYFRFKSGL